MYQKNKNNGEEEINLTPQDRIGNIDQCECGRECTPIATFAETLCQPHSMGGGSYQFSFYEQLSLTYLVDEFFFLFLVQLNKMKTVGESEVLSFCFWFEGGENFQNFFVLTKVFLRVRCHNLVHVTCL